MKRRLRWVLVWLVAVVCLLLSFGLKIGGTSFYIHGERSSGRWRDLVSLSSSRILRVPSTEFVRSRAGPGKFFLTPNMLLNVDDVGSVGPPWLDYRGPPAKCCGARANCRAAGHAAATQQDIEYPST
jgi:hypothetical protein